MKQGEQRACLSAYLPACLWGHPPSLICSMAIACCQRDPEVADRGRQLRLEHQEVVRYNFVLGEVVVWKCQCRAQSVSALQRAALPGTAELALNELPAQEGHNQLWCTSNTGEAQLTETLNWLECRQSYILLPCVPKPWVRSALYLPQSRSWEQTGTSHSSLLACRFPCNVTKATGGTAVDLHPLTACRDVLPSHCLDAANPTGPFIRMDDFWLASPKNRVVTARIHWMLLFIKQRPAQLTFPKHSWIWFRERAVKS